MGDVLDVKGGEGVEKDSHQSLLLVLSHQLPLDLVIRQNIFGKPQVHFIDEVALDLGPY